MRKSLLEAEQVELRKRELERHIMRDRTEDERKDSDVAKGNFLEMQCVHLLFVWGLTQSN